MSDEQLHTESQQISACDKNKSDLVRSTAEAFESKYRRLPTYNELNTEIEIITGKKVSPNTLSKYYGEYRRKKNTDIIEADIECPEFEEVSESMCKALKPIICEIVNKLQSSSKKELEAIDIVHTNEINAILASNKNLEILAASIEAANEAMAQEHQQEIKVVTDNLQQSGIEKEHLLKEKTKLEQIMTAQCEEISALKIRYEQILKSYEEASAKCSIVEEQCNNNIKVMSFLEALNQQIFEQLNAKLEEVEALKLKTISQEEQILEARMALNLEKEKVKTITSAHETAIERTEHERAKADRYKEAETKATIEISFLRDQIKSLQEEYLHFSAQKKPVRKKHAFIITAKKLTALRLRNVKRLHQEQR